MNVDWHRHKLDWVLLVKYWEKFSYSTEEENPEEYLGRSIFTRSLCTKSMVGNNPITVAVKGNFDGYN
jgi:hypothetical protein